MYPERRGEWPPPSKGIFYEYITSTLNLPPNNFDNKTTWERLPNYLYMYLNIIINVGNIDELKNSSLTTKWKTVLRDLLSGGKKTRRKKRKKRKSKRKVIKKQRKSIHRKRKKRKSKNRRRKY